MATRRLAISAAWWFSGTVLARPVLLVMTAGALAVYGATGNASQNGCVEANIAYGVSGAKFYVYDNAGIVQLRVDENGVYFGPNKTLFYKPADEALFSNSDSRIIGLVAGDSSYHGGQTYFYGRSVAAYPGWIKMSADHGASTYGGLTPRVQINGTGYYQRTRIEISDQGLQTKAYVTSIPTGGAWTTLVAIDGTQALRFATVTAHGTILLEWDGTTLTKLAGAATLVVSGSPSGTEIGFRVSGGNLQASNGTGTSRNGSSGFSIQH